MGEVLLTIGQVAREADVQASTIRYYESIGVLPEPERRSGQRRYRRDVIDRLRTIDVAKHAGFSLDETRTLFAADIGAGADAVLRDLALRKLREIDALIARAQAMRDWLAVATGCTCRTLDICTLFDEPARPGAPSPPSSCCR